MSIINVSGTVYYSMKIGGQDLINHPNLFDNFNIIENVNQSVPTLSFSLNDSSNSTVQELHLTDGLPIDIKMGRQEKDVSAKEFARYRIFNGDMARSNVSGHISSFNCLLDVPKYIGGSARIGIKGSSSEALRKLAETCGLTFKGDSTNDEQNWIGAGVSFSQWARQVARHGYITDKSCLAIAVTEDKQFLYKDLNDLLISPSPKTSIYASTASEDSESVLYASSNIFRTNSGFLNNWVNYGYLLQTSGINGKSIIGDLEIQKSESNIAMSYDIREAVETARIDTSVFDCGNTHENYERAAYQNLRYKSMFTESATILLNDYSGLNLFDVVELKFGHSASDPSLTVKSGSYILIGKTRVLKSGISYAERLELVRNYVRHDGLNKLVG